MKPAQQRLAVILFGLSVSTFLVACGGGSSSSGVVPDPDNTPADSAIEQPDPTVGDLTDCVEQLQSVSGGNALPTQFNNFDSICDYYVIGDINIVNDVIVEAGTTFVMAAGAKLTFRGSNSVSMSGSAERRIQFMGEDSTAGYWAGLEFSSVRTVELSYVDVIGGGGNDVSTNVDEDIEDRAGIEIRNATEGVALSHITIGSSTALGLLVSASELTLSENNRYFGNGLEAARFDSTNTSALNGSSDYSGGDQPNGRQYMNLGTLGFGTSFGQETRLVALDVPYRSSGMRIYEDAKLILEQDVNILFYKDEFSELPPALSVFGELEANGTVEAPVVLGLAPDEIAEHWRGLSANNAGILSLENVTIRRAGYRDEDSLLEEEVSNATTGSIVFSSFFDTQARADLLNVSIEDSASWGIGCNQSQMPLIERYDNVIFSDVRLGEVQGSCGF